MCGQYNFKTFTAELEQFMENHDYSDKFNIDKTLCLVLYDFGSKRRYKFLDNDGRAGGGREGEDWNFWSGDPDFNTD